MNKIKDEHIILMSSQSLYKSDTWNSVEIVFFKAEEYDNKKVIP